MAHTRPLPTRIARRLAGAAVSLVLLAGCSAASPEDSSDDASSLVDDGSSTTTSPAAAAVVASAVEPGADEPGADDLGAVGTLDSGTVHTVALEIDEAAFDEMVAGYTATGDKTWLEATVTIDGTTYEQVGVRLKGNSSLRGVSADDDPSTLPWLVRLDEFVDDQNHDGLTEFVVRSNNSATALNEAVSLELLDLAGLASQDAIAVEFSVNGGDPELRLVIDNPNDDWMAEEFDESGALYKAESTGDWSYRGDDPESYDDVFDQEAGDDNADLTPLMAFLEFVNDSDDATFAAELADWLDVDAFATYLAMQDLIDNFDDIDGPGNNAYLYYDTEAEQFTVVAWDHNLAFGLAPGGPGGPGNFEGGPGGLPGGSLPDGDIPPPVDNRLPRGNDRTTTDTGDPVVLVPADGGFPGGPDGGRGPGGVSNVLVERFRANSEWAALVESRTAELRAALYDSGAAQGVLDEWTAIVESSGLVDQATIDAEAARISTYF